jgi:hypothetical protein
VNRFGELGRILFHIFPFSDHFGNSRILKFSIVELASRIDLLEEVTYGELKPNLST